MILKAFVTDFWITLVKSGFKTLSEVPLGKTIVCSEKTIGQLWAASSLLKSKSLKNSGKSSVFSGMICQLDIPCVLRLSFGAAPLRKVCLPTKIMLNVLMYR